MSIVKIRLTNFRNISNLETYIDPTLNIFYGENGQGKTNVVEAIYYLGALKSFRPFNKEILIKENEDYSVIEAYDDKNDHYKVIISKDKQKFFINENEIRRQQEYIGNLNIVAFSPSDVSLFRESPKERRDLIDDEISRSSPAYDLYLSEYNKAKQERNKLLQEDSSNKTLIDTYTFLMAKYAEKIVAKRISYLKNVSKKLAHFYKVISGTKDELSVEYESMFIDKKPNEIFDIIDESFKEDVERKQTLLGPHKDDFIFYLNNKKISLFGSQGQNRIAVIALKLAIVDYIQYQTGLSPIVILDDVLSELDATRKNNLLNELVNKNQLLITCTNDIKISDNAKKYKIIDGSIGGNEDE